MFDHFRLLPFLVGLVGAFIILGIWKPEKEIIRQYPHPSKGAGTIYRDPGGTCYTYTNHEVDCDANESTLKDYPVQG